jgi:HAD superfamily hydrolase (TIGR01509 family)
LSFQGIIFDFNGTLFWDTQLHNQAWDLFLRKHGISLTDIEKNESIHGKNNRDILLGLIDRNLGADELARFSDEKEAIYREICLKENMKLAPGADRFLTFLSAKKIKMTIATASGSDNVDFYFKNLGLRNWFQRDKIVCDDGTLQSKPAPDFYLSAMDILGIAPGKTVIFEDSIAGIRSAQAAKAGKIIIVDSHGGDYREFGHARITDFGQVDREIFHTS